MKEELRTRLSNLDERIDSLSTQKIDNVKSLYSHPVLKHYLEDDFEKKRKDALRFVHKLKKEKSLFEEKLKEKMDREMKKRRIDEAKEGAE